MPQQDDVGDVVQVELGQGGEADGAQVVWCQLVAGRQVTPALKGRRPGDLRIQSNRVGGCLSTATDTACAVTGAARQGLSPQTAWLRLGRP